MCNILKNVGLWSLYDMNSIYYTTTQKWKEQRVKNNTS